MPTDADEQRRAGRLALELPAPATPAGRGREPHPAPPVPLRRYELAPMLQVRMAGVPFEAVERLATPRATALARELGDRLSALDAAGHAALAALRGVAEGETGRRRKDLRRVIGKRLPLRQAPAGAPAEVVRYAALSLEIAPLRARHAEALAAELGQASAFLRDAATTFLLDYSLFVSADVESLAFDDGEGGGSAHQRDRTLLMYVQRLATKNETMSAYGPVAWGRVDPAARGLRLPGRTALRRHVYFERWVAAGIVAAMNADPATRAEVAPRLHPYARLDADGLVRVDTGASLALDAERRALLARCDGRTPAHALGAAVALEALVADGALLWGLECPAFAVDRVGLLRDRVAAWREGEARRRWLPLLSALAEIPDRFARETAAPARREILGCARELLAELGAVPSGPSAPGQRVLYRASNALGEECAREGEVVLGGDLAREVADRAAPWFDLWRDAFAFAAHRVNGRLRAAHAAAGGGAVPLPAFLRAAQAAGLRLALNGPAEPAYAAFLEVKAAFREVLGARAEARVCELSAEDLGFLRRRHEFPRFDAFTWPSADLQLAARSAADVAEGRYRWLVGELHLGGVSLQHGMYWACPDEAAFRAQIRAGAGGPTCDWGFLPADLVSHALLHLEALPGLFTYAGPAAVEAGFPAVRPADVDVVATADGDVRMTAHGRDLGSFARSWVLAMGLHPFVLAHAPHTPRLEVGGVVVQRETWVVRAADLPRAPYGRAAPELTVDVDRLRAARGIPRHVFVRPTEAAVLRLGSGGRDKDVKPIYVDLESHPFLEVLARWLARHGEIEVVEMLPGPEELPWREPDGRHTFELRTLLLPAP